MKGRKFYAKNGRAFKEQSPKPNHPPQTSYPHPMMPMASGGTVSQTEAERMWDPKDNSNHGHVVGRRSQEEITASPSANYSRFNRKALTDDRAKLGKGGFSGRL